MGVLVLGMIAGAVIGGLFAYLTRARPSGGKARPRGWPVRAALVGALLGGVVAQTLPLLTGGYGPNVAQITSPEQFRSDVLEADLPVLVDFYKNGCPPCARLAPTLEALADEYAGRARIVKVDVAARPNLAREYGVKYTPTVVLFTNGQPARWIVGAKPADHYRTLLSETGPPAPDDASDSG